MGSALERPFGGDAKPLILVVEDNPETNCFLCETLAPEYRTTLAYSGQEAIEKAVILRPDLIIGNMTMPIANGGRFLAELRRLPELDNVPLVLLTAEGDEETHARSLRRIFSAWSRTSCKRRCRRWKCSLASSPARLPMMSLLTHTARSFRACSDRPGA
jgi:CheY-like chemotaxis protein